jgi:hypothetical protein
MGTHDLAEYCPLIFSQGCFIAVCMTLAVLRVLTKVVHQNTPTSNWDFSVTKHPIVKQFVALPLRDLCTGPGILILAQFSLPQFQIFSPS